MKHSPGSMKVIMLMQVLVLVFIRMNYGYTYALWALAPTILVGLIAAILFSQYRKRYGKCQYESVLHMSDQKKTDNIEIRIQGIEVYQNGFAEIIFSDGETMLVDNVHILESSLLDGKVHNSIHKIVTVLSLRIKGMNVYQNRFAEINFSDGKTMLVGNVLITDSKLAPHAQINIGLKTDI